ncbi:D-inositol 3-phosphate glycosyltransferase [Geobacter sp. OR-1]|uniref:glycosyltransferase family 4 protein n=1 Tax=Geobacter sp. OR-1 TaxID=1266765 RepID=UPI0005439637|nr:glycosyltransferase family 4 protein [Geobacter sp. OR-1]GAM07923.1 D-inositol 3-phosphate glycosyltransferase [Geobacter sp. OR-1]
MGTILNSYGEKPRIAVVVPKYGLVGGGERFVFEVTERLARQGRYEFHVFANRWETAPGSPVKFHKVPFISFPRSLRPYVFPWFAQRMIERGSFDLIHTHERIFRADIVSLHGTPHEFWVREVRKKRFPSLSDRGAIAIERQMLKNGGSSLFLPVSAIATDKFRDCYGQLPGSWELMHPGVEFERFNSPDRDSCRKEVRAGHGIGADDFLLLFVGMNFEVKGLDTIIAALAKAKAARPGAAIRLLVVGRGNEAKYRAIAASNGVASDIVFAGPRTACIERYYRGADAFVMLSRFDTFGMVVLEAMAAGLPVLLSPNVGAKDLVVNGTNGYITSAPEDSDTAANAILQLLDQSRRDRMAKAAAETASGHDWERLVERLNQYYEQFLENR